MLLPGVNAGLSVGQGLCRDSGNDCVGGGFPGHYGTHTYERTGSNPNLLADRRADAKVGVVADDSATAQNRPSSEDGVAADVGVVSYMAIVVDAGALRNSGFPECTSIDVRVREDLDIVFDYEVADVRHP